MFKSDNVLISIIISTVNKPWSVISSVLGSIEISKYKNYEVILVDQNKSDEIKNKIKDCSGNNIVYIKSENIGLSKGRNEGIENAKGRWFIFLDDDATLHRDSLEKISRLLTKNKDSYVTFYGKVLLEGTNKSYLKRFSIWGKKINLFNFDVVCSCSLIINRNIFEEIGYFDENLGAGAKFGAGEESDLILRMLMRKYNINFLNDFIVYHPASSLLELDKKRSYGMGVGVLYKKHIFSSFSYFFILSIKLFIEVLLRVLLIIINCWSLKLMKYHYFYLKGFIGGLRSQNTIN